MKKFAAFFLILLAAGICAAAGAEISFAPFPEEDTVYLFRRPLQGNIPPAPEAAVREGSVTITGLAPWGIPEEYMQTYTQDTVRGMAAAGAAQDGAIVFRGEPEQFSLSVPSDGLFETVTISLGERREYKGQYTVFLRMTDRNGNSLQYDTDDGSCTIRYGAMTASYFPDGMLSECQYRKETKKSTTYYRYQKNIRTDMPVYRLTYASYEDKKVTEEWDPDTPEGSRKKLKHLTPDKLPFRIIGQEEADRMIAERTASGLAWLTHPEEEAVCRAMQYPRIPEYDCVTGGGTVTITLTGLADWLITEEDMRTWVLNPADETWTPSEERLQDKAVFIIPWNETSEEDNEYWWSPEKSADPQWYVSFVFNPGKLLNERNPWSIDVRSNDGKISYSFYERVRNEGLVTTVFLDFSDRDINMYYEHDGSLSSYSVHDGTYRYSYRYSAFDNSYILYRIEAAEPNGGSSYRRDVNEFWYQIDPSGEQIPCDRPEEADLCPPLPLK